MSTLAEKLEYLDGTREKILTETNRLGVGLTEQDKFRDYAKGLHNGYVDLLNNGTDTLYDNMEKVSGSGSDITLENTEEAPMRSDLEGDTSQASTPTPDSPQPINVVSGRQEVDIVGKNLFKPFNFTKTSNGITFTYSEDGSINCNNTSTGTALSMNSGEATPYLITLQAGTYTISGYTNDIRLEVIKTDGSRIVISSENQTFALTETTSIFIRANIQSGKTFDNVKIYPQLEKGSTASEYEEYKGQSYEINLGKNLYYITPQTKNGITLSYDNDGTIVLNGTSTAGYTSFQQNVSLKGTFSLSTNNAVTQENTYVRTRNSNGTLVHSITLNNTSGIVTKTSEIARLEITIDATGITFNNFKIYAQLEKGSQATSYSPYKTPIELCEINDYKDMIFRGVGSNLYSSSIELGTINTTTGADETATNCVRSADYVEVKPNTTYTISNNKNYQNVMYFYGADKVLKRTQSGTPGIYTFTTYNDEFYIRNRTSQGSNQNDTSVLFQLVEGSYTSSTIPPYEPYNSKGKWLLQKQIGKIVLDGSESWDLLETNTNTIRLRSSSVIPSTALPYSYIKTYLKSNYFTIYSGNNGINPIDSEGLALRTENYRLITIRINKTIASDVANFKTWLNSHNTSVYYVLDTPTTTEITDTELISQLEEFYNTKSNKDVTYISVTSEYLPAILNVIAIKKYE